MLPLTEKKEPKEFTLWGWIQGIVFCVFMLAIILGWFYVIYLGIKFLIKIIF